MQIVAQAADLEHCWIRFVPRPWPGRSDVLWIDLATLRLGQRRSAAGDLRFAAAKPPDDLLYIPPVDPALTADRDGLITKLGEQGGALFPQVIVGVDRTPDCANPLFDVLHAVATEQWEAMSRLPPGASVVWPLVPGYTDDPAARGQGLQRLAAAGVGSVVGVAPELTPADRRQIIEMVGERGFDRLFHGDHPSVRAFSSAVAEAGMEPLPARPIVPVQHRWAKNRMLAGKLALLGDLWLRLDRSEAQGLAYFRAARWIDRAREDLAAAAREGNLEVFSWLDAASRAEIEAIVFRGDSALLLELRREYLQAPS